MTELLTLTGLCKAYPGVVANDDVSFEIMPGEVHALLGENGAGKSTLVKMIYGLVRPDAGEMRLHSAPYAPDKPGEARAAGVSMVFQHFSLFEALTVAENIVLGMKNAPSPRELAPKVREVSEEYGLPLGPERLVGDLSVGERQRVEIIRCLLQDPRLLIMDEPTSVLTPQEVEILFATLRKLSGKGVAILYISHKLEEIRALCDRATILRGGGVVATCTPREETAKSLAEMMIGQTLASPPKRGSSSGETLLELRNLSLASASPFGTSLRDIGLSLRASEVLGIAGVAGNGQDELLAALSGEALVQPEMLMLGGMAIGGIGPNRRRALGLLAAPEERLGHAAAPELSLTENAMLTGRVRKRLSASGVLNWTGARSFADAVIGEFDVRAPGNAAAAKALSGGNLQKFVIGREVLQEPHALVANQPTWGVDAAAAAAIRQALRDLADGGAAVLVISQDLDELMEVSDRLAVIAGGRLSSPQPIASLTIEDIGRRMGAAIEEPAHAPS